jgi:hypothetical protein
MAQSRCNTVDPQIVVGGQSTYHRRLVEPMQVPCPGLELLEKRCPLPASGWLWFCQGVVRENAVGEDLDGNSPKSHS